MHPTQATKLSFGWIRTGEKKAVETTGSRTRMNILGALALNDTAHPVIDDYETINDYSVCQFFNEIRKVYPDYSQPIHIILDGAGYNKANRVKDWAFICNITLHYLPPYSPNLNPIERLWKLMHELQGITVTLPTSEIFAQLSLTFLRQRYLRWRVLYHPGLMIIFRC